MASSALFPPFRRRRSPSLEALLAPVDLTDGRLMRTLLSLARELVSSSAAKNNNMAFQRKNSRSLIRKLEVFVVVLESLKEPEVFSSYTTLLCFKELYLLLYRSKILLDHCSQSSKLWLLLQNLAISGHFSDLNQEISTLLDVLPISELDFGEDVREQIELMQRQLRKAKLYVDKEDEALRRQLYSFMNEFENGRAPDYAELHSFFVHKLKIRDARSCRDEIEFLEEQICSHEGEMEPSAAVLYGFVSLARYCRFRLYGFEEDEMEGVSVSKNRRMVKKGLVVQEIANTFVTVPKDFCCPISLELMTDPVIVSTGQTYDKSSIRRWMDEGHCTCPKTGQMLNHKRLVPNRALRNLITQWCTANDITVDPSDGADPSSETASSAVSFPKAAFEANRVTVALLIQQLAKGSEAAKAIAAREIRLMAKTGKENRAYLAEAGAIPHLCKLMSSQNAVAQENSVTAILNLSIHDKNKSRIMEEQGCLELIINVLRFGCTSEARENAAATLFSLSAVHDYKRRIADKEGAMEALTTLLIEGTTRGKKDAMTALFNLSTHTENCARMIECGAVTAIVGALEVDGVSEEAAGALALVVRRPIGAEAVGNEESAVSGLIGMMRSGTPRGKENAVAALLELCRSGGTGATERVFKAPALCNLLQTLLFTGTKRARRKAASLARVFQRREQMAFHYGGLGVGYALAGNSAANRDSGYPSEVTLSMSISVPVV